MDVYHIWCDLKDSSEAGAFSEALATWLNHLKDQERLVSWRLLRRKLGFGPKTLGEFQILIETADLAQLDRAFAAAAQPSAEAEALHAAVYRRVTNVSFGLSRDFPDPRNAVLTQERD